jgi:hypothetical protein
LARLSSLASFCSSKHARATATVATLAIGGALAVGTAIPASAATSVSSRGSAASRASKPSADSVAATPQWVVAFRDAQASLAKQGKVMAAHEEQAAAARAAHEHAAQARAAAARAAASGDPRAIAKSMLAQYGWDASQFSYLNQLWFHESNWQVHAANASGAYGIPQALPGSQMASAGADWQNNPATQIKWGLNYIKGRYGSPSGAWAHEQSSNWY